MVDVSQELIIREKDCCEGREEIVGMPVHTFADGKEEIESLQERITGRFSCDDLYDNDGNIIVKKNQMITPASAEKIMKTTDKNGEPIIGATIKVKGGAATLGTITDIDGNFNLKVAPGSTLVISYIGCETKEVKAGANMKVVLNDNAKELSEVVVTGYTTQRKADLTGAVSVMNMKEPVSASDPNMLNSMQGKLAGVQVVTDATPGGGGSSIRVRGMSTINGSSPLLIIDGIASNENMNAINSADIESIQVLKDASSASIYGSRAANGVVIVTTKRGKQGKAVVNYSYNYSFQKYTDKYDLLSLGEWMQESNAASWEDWLWNNKVAPWGTKTLEEAKANPAQGINYRQPYTAEQIAAAGAGTDWLGLITRNGQIQEHNVSLQGGSELTQYMVSFNYYNHKGIVRNSGMTRYTGKVNVDQKFLDIFKAGLNLTLTRIDNDNTQLGSGRYENSGIIRSAIQMNPNVKAYDEETGTYPINPLLGQQPNPYSLLTNVDKGRTDRLLGNVFVEARPLAGLVLRVNAGIDHANIDRKTYQPRTTLYGSTMNGVAYIYNTANNQYLMEATATYHRVFGKKHDLNLLAVHLTRSSTTIHPSLATTTSLQMLSFITIWIRELATESPNRRQQRTR